MPSGELRRPPQLWEQRLARTTSILGVGISTSGDATSIVTPTPPPGAGGGTEPAPVLPPPGDFIKPSTPSLIGNVQGITVIWDGLNSAGDLWPYDTSFVEVHMDTSGTAFTPGTATLQGRLARPGGFYVGGLTAGTTYHFRLMGADPAGNYTEPSDAASGLTGLTTASDYGTATIGSGAVSFDARQIGGVTNTVGAVAPANPLEGDVWLDSSPGTAIIHKIYNGTSWVTNAWGSASIAAGQVTALQVAAGAITAGAIAAGAVTAEKIQAGAVTTDKLTAGTISGFYISGGTISGGLITGGTLTGAVITSSSVAGYLTPGDVGASGTTTISGDRITTGTVAAARIDVTNLVAEKVTSGPFTSRRVVIGGVGETDAVAFKGASTSNGWLMAHNSGNNGLSLTSSYSGVDFTIVPNVDIQTSAGIGSSTNGRGLRVSSSGEVFSYGIDDNTTANAANVRVGASAQLLKSTSTVRLKDELAPLADDLADVPADKLADFPASVDPYDVLTLTPTEFRSLSPADGDARSLGFIAEDVAAKLPWAANWDDDGLPSAVEDRPILAALLWVVRDQQATITDLRARIEALEA